MMATYMIDHRLQELWQQIDEIHLRYLHADESPHKIEEKRNLEAIIEDYLCIAPHESKFCFRETAQVLHRSIEVKDEFSPYRARIAWTSVAAYAHNLLAQPWRQEFTEIKMYCGFYKHNVEGVLIGGEMMFEVMGYKHVGGSVMCLEGPVDPDRVANASKDSFLAIVECQLIMNVYTELIKSFPDSTWLDVLKYRETHVGNPEQTLHGLTYLLHQKRYQDHCGVVDNSYSLYQHPMDVYPYTPQHFCGYTLERRYPQAYNMPSQIPYGGLLSPQQQFVPPNQFFVPNGYNFEYGVVQNGYTNPVPEQPNYSCSVPTGQLIELDCPTRNSNTHRRCVSDHLLESRDRGRPANNADYFSKKNVRSQDGGWDSWGYVYQTLEGNNSNHNHNDNNLLRVEKPVPLLEIENAFEGLGLEGENDTQSDIVSEVPAGKKMEVISSRINKIDFDSGVPVSTKTLGRDVPKKSNDNYLTLRVKLSDKWECTTCTYHNPESRDVCEMCGKSKKMGNEAQPLTSGGRQCPQCTLVNEKGVTECDACGTCLKDSPTYI